VATCCCSFARRRAENARCELCTKCEEKSEGG
jgi:hypothetical protein